MALLRPEVSAAAAADGVVVSVGRGAGPVASTAAKAASLAVAPAPSHAAARMADSMLTAADGGSGGGGGGGGGSLARVGVSARRLGAAPSSSDLPPSSDDTDDDDIASVLSEATLDEVLAVAVDVEADAAAAATVATAVVSAAPASRLVSHRVARILAADPSKAVTAEGRLQMEAQQAVAKNLPLRLYQLAHKQAGHMLPGLVASGLLALALQEGCTRATLEAVLATGATPHRHVLLRSDGGEPVRAVMPLLYAVEQGNEVAACVLMSAGADPLKADERGLVPLLEAMKDTRSASLSHRLKRAAIRLHGVDRVSALLRAHRPRLADAADSEEAAASPVTPATASAVSTVAATASTLTHTGGGGGCGSPGVRRIHTSSAVDWSVGGRIAGRAHPATVRGAPGAAVRDFGVASAGMCLGGRGDASGSSAVAAVAGAVSAAAAAPAVVCARPRLRRRDNNDDDTATSAAETPTAQSSGHDSPGAAAAGVGGVAAAPVVRM